MNIFKKIVELEIEYDSHESDLYIPVNEQTKGLIKEYEFNNNVTTFISQTDGKQWFEIPFAYDEFFNKKLRRYGVEL